MEERCGTGFQLLFVFMSPILGIYAG